MKIQYKHFISIFLFLLTMIAAIFFTASWLMQKMDGDNLTYGFNFIMMFIFWGLNFICFRYWSFISYMIRKNRFL